MNRRAVLASTAALVAASGCLGSKTSDEERAQQTVGSIAETQSVESWELEGDTLRVRYRTTGAIRTDVERVGLKYADSVDNGLDADLEATATGASKEFAWTVEKELANQVASGEISEEEFIDEVLE